jgi:hypothetical protein
MIPCSINYIIEIHIIISLIVLVTGSYSGQVKQVSVHQYSPSDVGHLENESEKNSRNIIY